MRSPIIHGVDIAKMQEQKDKLGYNYQIIGSRTEIYYSGISSRMQGYRPWELDKLTKVLSCLKLKPEDVFTDKAMLQHYKRELAYLEESE